MSYLFFDIDGTLVTDHHYISPATIKGISDAREAGHISSLCTGRSYAMCQSMLKTFDMAAAIVDNGAAVVDQGKTIIAHPISDDIVQDTITAVYQNHGSIELLSPYYCYQDQATYQMFYNDRKKFKEITDIAQEMYNEGIRTMDDGYKDICKMDVFFPTLEDAQNFRSVLHPALQYIAAGGYTKESGPKDGEIILKEVSKGTGIREFIRYKKGDMKDTYGFGDSDNDIGMLKAVAHPTIMRPGTPATLKLAEYIAQAPENGGIPEALSHYHLIGGKQ